MNFNGEKLLGFTQKDINDIYGTSQEVERVIGVLRGAVEQTKKKEIKMAIRTSPIIRLFLKVQIMIKYGIHWSKPFYIFRLIRNTIMNRLYLFLKINKYFLRGCEFDITFKCNFFCSHCSVVRLEEPSRKELEVRDYQRVVGEAMKLGAVAFGLEGGEPFMRKDWYRIIEVCRPKYNHIIITTNGFLFDEEKARRCAELGVDTINISLDSGIAELHDLFRKKKGSFMRAMNAIDLCRKYKIKVIINTVVHKHNLYTEGFRKLLEFSQRHKILVHVLFAKAVGNFMDNGLMLDSGDFKAYEKIAQSYPYVFIHHATRFNSGSSGCNGTKEMLQLTPYGDVMNCANMHIYFGNVMHEPLAEIRRRALKETPFGRYRPCFLALDKDFMNIYYPLLAEKLWLSIEDFRKSLEDYEKKYNKIVYPEIHYLYSKHQLNKGDRG